MWTISRDHVFTTGAIAASFLWCELMQPVDLMAALVSDRGFSEPEAAALLDASPSLQFSICYGARLDCRAVCEVSQLLRLTSVAERLSEWLTCCCSNKPDLSGTGCLALGSVHMNRVTCCCAGRRSWWCLTMARSRSRCMWGGRRSLGTVMRWRPGTLGLCTPKMAHGIPSRPASMVQLTAPV